MKECHVDHFLLLCSCNLTDFLPHLTFLVVNASQDIGLILRHSGISYVGHLREWFPIIKWFCGVIETLGHFFESGWAKNLWASWCRVHGQPCILHIILFVPLLVQHITSWYILAISTFLMSFTDVFQPKTGCLLSFSGM